MLVTAVEIIGKASPDEDDVALFTGMWVEERTPADRSFDGDLVVRLTAPHGSAYEVTGSRSVDVEMLRACQGRWQRVGQWRGLDDGWPCVVAFTLSIHGDLDSGAVSEQGKVL
ncbi:hypothetical protein ACFFUZ_14805, partial [Kibdelosporangium philippinense]